MAGLADQHAVAGAQQRGGLVQHRLHQPRVLAVLGGQRARPLARLDLAPARAPAPRPWTRPCGRPPGRRRRPGRRARARRRSAARSSPARTSGQARQRAAEASTARAGHAGTGGRREARERSSWRSAPRVEGAWPRRPVERRGEQLEVRAGVHVERQRRHRLDRAGRPRPPRASLTWRSRLPGPKPGSIASGGLSSSALVPSPWRSGPRSRPSCSSLAQAQQPGHLAGLHQRRVARAPAARARSRAPRVADPDQRRRRLARPARCRAAPATRSPSAASSATRSAVTTTTASRPGTRRSEASTSREHRLGERLARSGAERGGQPLLGGAEALHREDRDRAHRAASRA